MNRTQLLKIQLGNCDEVPETRKGYTGYEKDTESGLQCAQARYYNTAHGRFTSVDPLTASANAKNPQTFNRYSYVLNSPYKFTDPLGLAPRTSGSFCAQWCNGTGPMATGTFFGIDTSMGTNMMRDLDVARAINTIDSSDFDNRFESGATLGERAVLKKELKRVLNGGNLQMKLAVIGLVEGGVHFNVHAPIIKGKGRSSGQTAMRDIDGLNKKLKSGCSTASAFMEHFIISINRDEMNNSASINGNILHEAVHVGTGAFVLAKWSSGDKNFDVTGHVEEYSAKTTSICGLQALGGIYVQYAQSITYVDQKGQQNLALFDALAKSYAVDFPSTGSWLKSWGVQP